MVWSQHSQLITGTRPRSRRCCECDPQDRETPRSASIDRDVAVKGEKKGSTLIFPRRHSDAVVSMRLPVACRSRDGQQVAAVAAGMTAAPGRPSLRPTAVDQLPPRRQFKPQSGCCRIPSQENPPRCFFALELHLCLPWREFLRFTLCRCSVHSSALAKVLLSAPPSAAHHRLAIKGCEGDGTERPGIIIIDTTD